MYLRAWELSTLIFLPYYSPIHQIPQLLHTFEGWLNFWRRDLEANSIVPVAQAANLRIFLCAHISHLFYHLVLLGLSSVWIQNTIISHCFLHTTLVLVSFSSYLNFCNSFLTCVPLPPSIFSREVRVILLKWKECGSLYFSACKSPSRS